MESFDERTAGELVEHFSRLPPDCKVIFTAMIETRDGRTIYAGDLALTTNFDVRDRDAESNPKLTLVQLGGDAS